MVLATPVGAVRARAAILTVSTAVLADGAIKLPRKLDPWRHAAARLPLGRNEKLFLEIAGDGSFAPETRVLGDPHDRRTGVYYIRPFGWPVIECFLGDEGARMVEEMGPTAGFAHATDQLAALFGSTVTKRHSELSLERLNLPRQRRLRDMEHLRRAPKSVSINHLDEVAQSSEFHWLPML